MESLSNDVEVTSPQVADSQQASLATFTAENILLNSPIMKKVLQLRDTLSRESNGDLISYEKMFIRIQDEVDALPVLELQMSIPEGAEGAYQRQLLQALGQINDDHDRVLRRVIKLKSRLMNALDLMKSLRSQFAAFYIVAIPIAIHYAAVPKMKLTAAHAKEMAEAEFSRLMDNLDGMAISILSELDILESEIKGKKKSQADKYQLGKDQVNAMWNSIQSNGAIGLDDNPTKMLRLEARDEDEDEIPSFVSKYSKEVRIASSPSYVASTDTLCAQCGEKQFDTPSGACCANGHGRAPSVTAEIKGTFFKTGDAKPIQPVLNEDGEDSIVELDNGVDELNVALGYDIPNEPPASLIVLEPKQDIIDFIDSLVTTPKPVLATTPIVLEEEEEQTAEELEALFNEPEVIVPPTPSTPRRKLLILDEEDI